MKGMQPHSDKMTEEQFKYILIDDGSGSKNDGGDSFSDHDRDNDNNNGPVTMLAKYEHASDCEAQGIGDGGDICGEALTAILQNDPPNNNQSPSSPTTTTIGGFKVVQSSVHQVVYGRDSDGLGE